METFTFTNNFQLQATFLPCKCPITTVLHMTTFTFIHNFQFQATFFPCKWQITIVLRMATFTFTSPSLNYSNIYSGHIIIMTTYHRFDIIMRPVALLFSVRIMVRECKPCISRLVHGSTCLPNSHTCTTYGL